MTNFAWILWCKLTASCFSDAGDMLTYFIQSSLPLPFSYWCTVSTLSLRFCVWYNIVTSLLSIPENPRERFFVWSLWYFNIELNKSLVASWFHVLIIEQCILTNFVIHPRFLSSNKSITRIGHWADYLPYIRLPCASSSASEATLYLSTHSSVIGQRCYHTLNNLTRVSELTSHWTAPIYGSCVSLP